MPTIKFINSDPSSDPTHPDSPLNPRHKGDIFFRLVRKFGTAKGMRLFGFLLAMSEDDSVDNLLGNQRQWEYTNDLKSCGLVADEIKPGELGVWTRELFKLGFNIGMTAAQFTNPANGGSKTQPAD